MGEIAEGMLDGTLCDGCGAFVGDPVGHPRKCYDCLRDAGLHPPSKSQAKRLAAQGVSVRLTIKDQCPICNRRVRLGGLADHHRAVHDKGA